MINGIKLKICGITSLVDADAADAVGADYLGFIFHPKSPRAVTLTQYLAMADRLPPRKRVAVVVGPTVEDLAVLAAAGFDCFQIHFDATTSDVNVAAWAEAVGRLRLWLAPKLPAGQDVRPAWLAAADTILLDTFHAEKFGGTGETGDWEKFRRHREAHPANNWILSGGLNAANIAAAVTATGARFIDVNSGVEQAPGVKSPDKLMAFMLAMRNATKRDNPADG